MRSISRTAGALVLLALSTVLVSGCGSATEPVYPVTGKVTLKGTPLTAGIVTFLPDEAKGNKTKLSPTGQIGADGTYKLTTDNRTGAPLGWYKVIVNTEVPGMSMTTPDPTRPGVAPGPAKSVQVDPKYRDALKTDLHFEVVASPGPDVYDLKLLR
jgi:hypothetical protein